MCAMVLAVQAAAVKTYTGGKSIQLLGRELKLTNASAMLGELEKMAMSTSGAGPDATAVEQIKDILEEAILVPILEEPAGSRALVRAALKEFEDAFTSCNNDAKYADGVVKNAKDAVFVADTGFKALHDACRHKDHGNWSLETTKPTTNDKCDALEDKLKEVEEARTGLGALPGIDELAEDGVTPRRVKYVQEASTSAVCISVKPEWDACEKETDRIDKAVIANQKQELAHKTNCLDKQVDFENGICDWRAKLHTELMTCKNHTGCYQEATDGLTGYNNGLAAKVAKWKNEFLAVQKILCYLNAWKTNTTSAHDTEFAVCTAKTLADFPSVNADGTPKGDDKLEADKYDVTPGVVPGAPDACSTRSNLNDADIAAANIFPNGKGNSAAFEDEYYNAATFHTSWQENDIVTCADTTVLSLSLLQGSLLAQPKPIARDIAAKPIAADKIKREKKLVRREPKKPKPSSLAELDSQGRMLNVKVQAQKHSTSELQDMNLDALMDLVKTSGANTLAIKAAMARSILKLQASSV